VPHSRCGIVPRRGIMPQLFLLIYFFWHDFYLFGTIFDPNFSFWHAINPYHQTIYKVPPFCRRKSLVSKGLRSAGQRIFTKFLLLNALRHLKTNVIGKFAILEGGLYRMPLIIIEGRKSQGGIKKASALQN